MKLWRDCNNGHVNRYLLLGDYPKYEMLFREIVLTFNLAHLLLRDFQIDIEICVCLFHPKLSIKLNYILLSE